nr:DUF397 domain-containing protein [Streptomyces olivoverticillatus]
MASEEVWQKSSFSGEGDACLYLARTSRIHLRESDTPHAVVTTSPDRLRPLISRIKTGAL